MPAPIGIGVIGTGFGADVILPALQSESSFIVRAISGGESGRALYSPAVKASGLATTSVDALLAANNIQAVVVAVPPFAQLALVEKALRAGKHVLCEKPFTANLDQAIKACSVASSSKCLLAVDYEFRYDALVESCLEQVAVGRIGKLKNINVRWWNGGSLRDDRRWSWRDDIGSCGGVLTEWCSHVVDYLPLIGGASFSDISCWLRTEIMTRLDMDDQPRSVTVPDGCVLKGRLEGDIRVLVDVSTARTTQHGHRIELCGEHGNFIAEIVPPYGSAQLSCSISVAGVTVPEFETITDSDGDTRAIAIGRLLRDFAARINGSDRARLPTCKGALATWNTISAAFASAREGGRPISLSKQQIFQEVK